MGKERAMGTRSSTTDSTPPAAFSAVDSEFVGAVRSALPPAGLWTMPVLVAVSGGADSVALLVALRCLVPAGLERRLIVAHAEHDLRDSACDDRAFAGDLAARLGLPFTWRRVEVCADDGDEGLEGRARRLRYAFLLEVAHEFGARHVMVGHTADDQAETILLRMLRGTGLAGIGGMTRARELADGISLLRPLLDLRREAARRFLESVGQSWRDDPTNADRRHARNFIRHDVLAPCAAGPFPAATESLVRLGQQASLVAGALRSAAEHLLESCSCRHADGSVVLRMKDLVGLDRHLIAEVFVALWRREGWPQQDMTARHYAALAAMAGGYAASATACDAPGRIAVRRLADGHLHLQPPSVLRERPRS
jgi:tRNA(Ile)-lysidine synthase